jgi:16S rRNA (adenine1518-N6/adenine1519-N6)-dimethyltransferase
MTHVPTQTEIRALLDAAGLRPDRRYGQHFLVDGNLMRLVAAAADLSPRDTVLEVGPGVGNLTGLLLAAAGRVVAVEVDPDIAAIARERLGDAENLDLLVTDILADKHHVAPEVLAILARRAAELGGPVKLVANLPYAAATPLVAELAMADAPPERLVFTVQEEVAHRLAAPPGTSDYGPVGVLVQAVAEVELVRRLPPSVFWPPPKVSSSLVRVTPREALRVRIRDLPTLRRVVEGLFIHRRKRAPRSLALAWPDAGSPATWAARLKAVGLNPEARGETYTVEEIIRLAGSIDTQPPHEPPV